MNKNETVRLTKTTIAVLEALLAASDDRPVWGRNIAETADMETSSVSVILTRLRGLGWIESWWEDTSGYGGHRRQFHELTPVGYSKAVKALLAREERRRRIFG
jgi:DNA-binding MarR family transcriptional regulator